MRTTSAAGRLPIAATLGCAAAVALAGCTVVRAASSAPHSDPPLRTKVVSASGQTPKQRAKADVVAIMKRFVKPPGASQVSADPVAGLKGVMALTPASPDVATKTTFWVARPAPTTAPWTTASTSR